MTGATPGQFFAFITAFLLAYEPAKRLARLNIELNSGLVGVRMLFRSDRLRGRASRPTTTSRRSRWRRRGWSSTTCILPIAATSRCCDGVSFFAERGKLTALVGPLRRRQVDRVQPDPALLRVDSGQAS